MQELYIVKVGGNIIDDEAKLSHFLQSFASLKAKKILVHGGGKLATRIAEALAIPQQMVDGRRITDVETLKVVTMVYAGYINKNIVAQLQGMQVSSIGLCGPDANIILAHKRENTNIDYGYAGDIDEINVDALSSLLEQNLNLVIAPISHNGKGQLLNTNADTIASEIARSMSKNYKVSLIYSFEKAGVLLDVADESSRIPAINPVYYRELKSENKIFAGMIPKLDNAFKALDQGVHEVIIGPAEKLHELVSGKAGTKITAGN
ncbi:acetylglutamate kinase [Pollutibacter soli]|uniref:acetylglutamate kinase n=1 Tax=Pollutibacter soli TaxID=3034157 RepID=UPI003013A50D